MAMSGIKKLAIFDIVNALILLLLAFSCLLPFVNVLAISLSSTDAANRNVVSFWPVDITAGAYRFVLARREFWQSMLVSFERLLLGVPINMILTILAAYPLSKTHRAFRARAAYVWFFFITMLFSGGMIPTYLIVRQTHLMDTIWALVLPGAVPVFSIVVLLNFFRHIPCEIEEAAVIDGASQWRILWQLWVPLSMPALATLTLFSIVGHWNAWFDGLIYMNTPVHYPMQSFLQTVVVTPDISKITSEEWRKLQTISDRTVKAAQIIVAALPVLAFYPFLQKYFVSGMVLGSVKG